MSESNKRNINTDKVNKNNKNEIKLIATVLYINKYDIILLKLYNKIDAIS